jgi:hypothetical protein
LRRSFLLDWRSRSSRKVSASSFETAFETPSTRPCSVKEPAEPVEGSMAITEGLENGFDVCAESVDVR